MNRHEWLAQQLQALAHPTRLRILEILTLGPACVCDLVRLTGKRQPYISQHLIILRKARLVTTERQDWNICYHLNEAKLAELEQLMLALLKAVTQPPSSEAQSPCARHYAQKSQLKNSQA